MAELIQTARQVRLSVRGELVFEVGLEGQTGFGQAEIL